MPGIYDDWGEPQLWVWAANTVIGAATIPATTESAKIDLGSRLKYS